MQDGVGIGSHEKLHLRHFLVDFLHELYYKVDQLVLKHLLGMEVGDEEGNVIALGSVSCARGSSMCIGTAYLDSLPSQDEKGLGALGQEASELVDEDVLNLIGLLDPDAYTDTVYAGLYEDSLVLVSGDGEGV